MISTLTSLYRHPSIVAVSEIKLTSAVRKTFHRVSAEEFKKIIQNSKFVSVYEITYLSDGYKIQGFIVAPKERRRLPVIIFNRGGGGKFGSLSLDFVFGELSIMARWGYVVFASQYRGGVGSEGKDEIGGADLNDILNLYPIIKSYSNSDIKRIGIFGGSRGGMMAYLMLKKRIRWIKAIVSIAGMTNLVRDVKSFRIEMKEYYEKAFGGSLKELKKRSALYWVNKFPKKVPILLMHGFSDWRVNPKDSIDLSVKFYECGVPHRLVVFEGTDHELTECKTEALDMARQWFDKYVRDRKSLSNFKPHGS